MPSVLETSGADYLCYGMGERPMLELTRGIEAGWGRRDMQKIPQIAFKVSGSPKPGEGVTVLHSFEECLKNKRAFAENFHHIETLANMMHPDIIREGCGDGRPGQSTLSACDSGGDGFVLGSAFHKTSSSEVQGQENPGLRYDKVLHHHSQGMFRRLQFLHNRRPSGQIHPVPFGGIHREGSQRAS